MMFTVLFPWIISPGLSSPGNQVEWTFEDGKNPFEMQGSIEGGVVNGVLRLKLTGGDGTLQLPPVSSSEPIRLRIRMRSGEGAFGRGEFSWTNELPERGFGYDRIYKYPMQHDMEWREYDFPLPVSGNAIHLRFKPAWKPGRVDIDWVRVESNPLPPSAYTSMKKLPRKLIIENADLRVVFVRKAKRIDITDKRTNRRWWQDIDRNASPLVAAEKLTPTSMRLVFWDNTVKVHYVSTLSLHDSGVLRFELNSDHHDRLFWGLRNWPPRLETKSADFRIIFCDRSSGTMIQHRDKTYGGRALGVYGNTSCLDMPWMGMFDWKNGDGVMIHIETPVDAIINLDNDDKGRIWPQVLWEPSLDTFRYPRVLSLRFTDEGGYVEMARLYRQIVKENGLWLPFEERVKTRPEVARLKGSPMIWGGRDVWDFTREGRTAGILHATYLNAQHGLRDRSSIKKLNTMGYLTGPYDSFTDIREGPTGQGTDNIEKTAYHLRPGLGPAGGWIMENGNQLSDRSSAFARKASETYVPLQQAEFGYNTRFIDVAMAIGPKEDWHPEHTFDRRQDLALRRHAYSYLNKDLRLILGTEHGNDWGVDLVDFFEGASGGPFYWDAEGEWNAGHLAAPKSRNDYSENYLNYGITFHNSIPLWQLVYGDCVVSTFYWGDTAGIHYAVAPEFSDRKDLFNILYGTSPILWRDNTGYKWPQDKQRFLRTYHETTHWHQVVGFSRMTNHVFLGQDMALQRSDFDNGGSVTVNFSDRQRIVKIGDKEITLAPRGFHAQAPDYHQSRLLEDGEVITRIISKDFQRYESRQRRKLGPVDFKGLFSIFKINESRWQMDVDPNQHYTIDVSELTDWKADADIRLMELDKWGESVRLLRPVRDGSQLKFTSGSRRYFALTTQFESSLPVIYPPSGNLPSDQRVIISGGSKDWVVRYTLDGSEPTVGSKVYPEPLVLKQSTELRARFFDTQDHPLGKSESRNYTVLYEEFHSPLMSRHDEALPVQVRVVKYNALRIEVTPGPDHPWNDYVSLADAKFTMKDGSVIYLSDIDPQHHRHTVNHLARDAVFNGSNIQLDGTEYDKGLHVQGDSEMTYVIPQGAITFSAIVGIDDSTVPLGRMAGSAEVFLQGIVGSITAK